MAAGSVEVHEDSILVMIGDRTPSSSSIVLQVSFTQLSPLLSLCLEIVDNYLEIRLNFL